jgi:uncharacterized membrane protein YeaQ/YmgE (transglycosylase-associated protein family)
MEPTSLIAFLAIGAVAGWLAGLFMKSGGSGLLFNMLLGIVGAVIGGWVFSFVGVATGGVIGSLITAVVGACLLLFVVGLFKN